MIYDWSGEGFKLKVSGYRFEVGLILNLIG